MVAGIENVSSRPDSRGTAIGMLFVGMLALAWLSSAAWTPTRQPHHDLFGLALGGDPAGLVRRHPGRRGQHSLHRDVRTFWRCLQTTEGRPARDASRPDPRGAVGAHRRRGHRQLQSVGSFWSSGCWSAPTATAALVVRTVPRMMAVAAALFVASVWLGILLSYLLGTAGSLSWR